MAIHNRIKKFAKFLDERRQYCRDNGLKLLSYNPKLGHYYQCLMCLVCFRSKDREIKCPNCD